MEAFKLRLFISFEACRQWQMMYLTAQVSGEIPPNNHFITNLSQFITLIFVRIFQGLILNPINKKTK